MGLRCLLGHDFGDVEVEREREEDGNEMVVTIREIKTCNRCGKERVVSENKEVTSIMTPEEAGIEEEPDSAAESEEPTHPAVEETEEFEVPEGPEEDDAVILDEAEPEPDRRPGEWPDAEQPQSSTTPMQDEAGGPDEEPAAESTEDVAAVEEAGAEPAPVEGEEADVEFLEGESTDQGTAGATSNDAESESSERSASEWPEHKGEDEGFDAEAGGGEGVSFGGNGLTPEVESDAVDDEDVEFIDADDTAGRAPYNGSDETGSARGEGSASAETSTESAEYSASAETSTESAEYSGSEETRTESAEYSGSEETRTESAEYAESEGNAAVEDAGGSHVSGPSTESTEPDTGIAREESASIDLGPVEADTEYYCPNCGMTRNAGGSSMRAGDICPECRKGYITERDI